VFERLYEKNALMISIGLDSNSTFSITDHAEKISGACTYRYDKLFSGIYVGEWEGPKLSTYSMMVRKIEDGVETFINPAFEDLIKDGVVKEFCLAEARCHHVSARVYTDRIIEIVRNNPQKLYRTVSRSYLDKRTLLRVSITLFCSSTFRVGNIGKLIASE